MSHPYRVVLRIGSDYVASNHHFPTWEAADKARKKLLSSRTVYQDNNIGVRVMHWRKFKELMRDGSGTTVERLKNNAALFGSSIVEKGSLYVKLARVTSGIQDDFQHFWVK